MNFGGAGDGSLSASVGSNQPLFIAITDDGNPLFPAPVPPTPREKVAAIIDEVSDLISLGVLPSGKGKSLLAKLDAAIQKIDYAKKKRRSISFRPFLPALGGGYSGAADGRFDESRVGWGARLRVTMQAHLKHPVHVGMPNHCSQIAKGL